MSLLQNSINWIKKQFILEDNSEIITAKEIAETILLNDLSIWLDIKENDYLTKSGLVDEANIYVNNIKELKWKIEGRLEEWEHNFPPIKKLKREEILRLFSKVRQLLVMIAFSEKADVKEVQRANALIEQKLDFLIRKMENATYHREFSIAIGEDEKEIVETVIIGPILSEMLKMRKLKEDFEHKVGQSDLGKINSLRESMLDLRGFKLIQEELELEISSKESHLKIVEDRIIDKEKEISQLNHKIFPNLSEDEKNKRVRYDELLVELNNLKEAVYSFFNQIKPAMEEYYSQMPETSKVSNLSKVLKVSEMSDRGLLKKYFDEPFDSFCKDENLLVLKLLSEIEYFLNNNQFNINDPEAEKIISLISGAEESLRSLQINYRNIISELNSLKLEMGIEKNESSFLDRLSSLKIGDAQYRLNHFKAQADKLRQEIADSEIKVQEQLNQQNKEKEMLIYNIKLVIGKKVDIKL